MDSKIAALQTFLQSHPQITFITSSSPEYASLRASFALDNTATPLAIVRPQSANDAALLVEYAKSNGIKFVIRTGGHNIFGQSIVQDTLSIDMRDISYVETDKSTSTAKVGGGILLEKLAEELAKEGLTTPMGSVPSIGYVGWASYGGYGFLSAGLGLGVDQIVGAKVVTSKGKIVEADEKLLKGVRGAGGVFGPIVELTVKVYPLKTLLAGMIVFDSQDISASLRKFNEGYQALSAKGLPPQMVLYQLIGNTPMGRAFIVGFTWASEDEATGRKWLQEVESLGTVLMNTVEVATIPGVLAATAQIVPAALYGKSHTHNIREMSNEVTDIISRNLGKMPSDPGTLLCIHQLRGVSAQPKENSVFGTRDPHFMLEIVGGSVMKENREQALDWSVSTWKELEGIDSGNLLPGTYISLDPPSEQLGKIPLSKLFGANAQEIFALKEKHDPEDVFDLAVPRLKNYA